MRIRNLIAAFVASLFVFCTPALAFETTPTISEAQCAIVCDSSGNVLWSMNADREMALASITKVMTAVVALDSGLDLDSPCTISYVDLGPYSQTAGFTESDTPTLRELLRVMLVYSGNDAAVYIAQNVAGSEEAFVTLMNEKARELGMTHTHFANPHGLEADGHYSSVADLVILGDPKISREKHMLITYDPENRKFYVAPASGANIVRLNDKSLVGGAEELKNYDVIRTGDTSLMFIAFCGPEFGWEDL